MSHGQFHSFGSSKKLKYKLYKEVHLPNCDLQEYFSLELIKCLFFCVMMGLVSFLLSFIFAF